MYQRIDAVMQTVSHSRMFFTGVIQIIVLPDCLRLSSLCAFSCLVMVNLIDFLSNGNMLNIYNIHTKHLQNVNRKLVKNVNEGSS